MSHQHAGFDERSRLEAAALNANSFNSNSFNKNPFNTFQAHSLSTILPTPAHEGSDPFDVAPMANVPPPPEMPNELHSGPASVAVA